MIREGAGKEEGSKGERQNVGGIVDLRKRQDVAA
jgi:hypothetical protein